MLAAIKASWRDVDAFLAEPWATAPRLVEAHLLHGDVAGDRARFVEAFAPLADRFALALHQPARLPDGRFLDPVAADPGQARASLRTLEAAAELASDVEASFLVVHPGGVRGPGGPPARAADAVAAIGSLETAVPLLLENMPWWHHMPDGSTGHSTLGHATEDLLAFEDVVAGYCLDVCHAWGARAPGDVDHVRELLALGDRIKHVHASDAQPPTGEGLPFGTGEIGAALLQEVDAVVGPRAACVPEIKGMERDRALQVDAVRWLHAAGVVGR